MIKVIFVLCFIIISASSSWGARGLCTDKNVPIKNFHTVTLEDVQPSEDYDCTQNQNKQVLIYRGSRPGEKGIEALVKLGVKTDLDLEDEDDVVKKENSYIQGRMNFYSEPMEGTTSSSDKRVAEVMSIITNPANYPLYVHCQRGIDRTGFVVAMLRISEGWAPTRAVAEWNLYRDIDSEIFASDLYEWGKKLIGNYFTELHPPSNQFLSSL